MQTATDSTVSYTHAEDPVDRQDMVAYYVDQVIRRVVERPYDSVPQLFQYAVRGGPCLTPADVLRLFGGGNIFRNTCRRMSVIRRAVLNNEMHTIPVDLRTWTEWEQPEMDPPFTDYRGLWCPHLDSPELFWYRAPGMEEEICRYPAVLGTDEFFSETGNESWQTDITQEPGTDESDWFGVLRPISYEHYWEMPDESWVTDTAADSFDNESDSEEWRRPPPINTAGWEWFYE